MQSIPISTSRPYETSFPCKVILTDRDPNMGNTFFEGLISAKKNHIPYFVISIIKSLNKDSEANYNIFEASPLYIHLINCLEANSPFTDPTNNREIVSIHYFAIECFKLDNEAIFKPIDHTGVDHKNFSFLPIELSHPFPKIKPDDVQEDSSQYIINELVDCLNYHNIVEKEDEIFAREKQFYIASNIEKISIFKHLTPEQVNLEKIKWLWCSTQSEYRSCRSIMELSQQYWNFRKENIALNELIKIQLNKILITPSEIDDQDKKFSEQIEITRNFLTISEKIPLPD